MFFYLSLSALYTCVHVLYVLCTHLCCADQPYMYVCTDAEVGKDRQKAPRHVPNTHAHACTCKLCLFKSY